MESLEQSIRKRIEALAMTGEVKASPEARRFLSGGEPDATSVDEEVDYLAEHALAVARSIATGSTGEHGVRVSIVSRFEIVDEHGEIDIVAVETEVDGEGTRFWISKE